MCPFRSRNFDIIWKSSPSKNYVTRQNFLLIYHFFPCRQSKALTESVRLKCLTRHESPNETKCVWNRNTYIRSSMDQRWLSRWNQNRASFKTTRELQPSIVTIASCRFEYQYCEGVQVEKCSDESSTFKRMYDFCPLDLFSGSLERMRKAITSLLIEPHRRDFFNTNNAGVQTSPRFCWRRRLVRRWWNAVHDKVGRETWRWEPPLVCCRWCRMWFAHHAAFSCVAF